MNRLNLLAEKQKALDVEYMKDSISPRGIQFRENKLITRLRQSSRRMTPYSKGFM